jgi:hypothetical protein
MTAQVTLQLDVAREHLDTQLSFVVAIESKVSALLGVGSTLVGLLAAVLALNTTANEQAAAVVVSLAVGLYVSLTIVWWFGAGVSEWAIGPDLDQVRSASASADENEILDRLTASYIADFKENVRGQNWKVRMLHIAFALVFLETLCVASAAFLTIFG